MKIRHPVSAIFSATDCAHFQGSWLVWAVNPVSGSSAKYTSPTAQWL